MPFSPLPKLICTALTDVRADLLHKHHIRLLMLDFDNTIVPYTTNDPTPEMARWLKEMLASDIQICVVSNSKRDRVKIFCEKYGIPCITHSKKPFSRGINQCLARFSQRPEHSAIAGDQIFTDTLGGNCAGLTSILVKPIHNHTIWLKLRHVAEMPFIFLARKRRLSK